MGPMGAQIYLPRPPLSELVECFWAWSGYPAMAARERILPAGTLDLSIHLDGKRFRIYPNEDSSRPELHSGAILSGARAGSSFLGTSEGARLIGVHFKPGGARRFFDVPAGELEEKHVAIEALWGRNAGVLHEQLSEARSMECAFALLEQFLIQCLRSSDDDLLLRHALRAFDDPLLESVAAVCAEVGCSRKELLTLFRDRVGLAPKAYWRVRRFQAALNGLTRERARGAELAATLGYFDQAHFNREFRFFTGMSPTSYLVQTPIRPNHIPMAEPVGREASAA
jgi:AraC-like DNA-binding protein